MNNEELYDKAEKMAEEAICNVKCLCPKLKEAGICCQCEVFTSLRDYYVQEEIKSFANSSWAEIKEIAYSGKAKEYFVVGDEREEMLYTGEKITLVILGFDHDKTKDGKAAISIGLKNLIDGDFEMNIDCTNEGGWEKSRMRTVYMERLYRVLPEELRNIIAPVKKNTSKGGESSEIAETEDKLFLFSLAEIFSAKAIGRSSNSNISKDANVYGEEGDQYEYFKQLLGDADPYDDNDKIIKYKADGGGSAHSWWLRSPYTGGSTYFRYISNSGGVFSDIASYAHGVCFGFCI